MGIEYPQVSSDFEDCQAPAGRNDTTWEAGGVRVAIHVRPGSKRAEVGGAHDGALVVRVSAPAVDGKATAAATGALADALGLPRRDVVLVSGATSRRKIVEIPDTAGATYAALKDAAT
jgi:uncharacterized protein (TIGR00251 family)